MVMVGIRKVEMIAYDSSGMKAALALPVHAQAPAALAVQGKTLEGRTRSRTCCKKSPAVLTNGQPGAHAAGFSFNL
jgi:hypothetical protein